MRKLSKFLREIDPIVHLFFLIAIIILFAGYFFLSRQIGGASKTSSGLKGPIFSRDEKNSVEVGSSAPSLSEIEKLIADAIATISAVPRTIIKTVTQQRGSSYITLGSTATTTSTDWVDAEAAEVYIDLENDYGKDAKVSWQASLKVAHGNGQAFVRLYDDTNKIAVIGSELSTTNNADFEQISSANFSFWKGRNLYKVQIKSLNSFEVTYSGGRIKISY